MPMEAVFSSPSRLIIFPVSIPCTNAETTPAVVKAQPMSRAVKPSFISVKEQRSPDGLIHRYWPASLRKTGLQKGSLILQQRGMLYFFLLIDPLFQQAEIQAVIATLLQH
jgi:hypothetical protein